MANNIIIIGMARSGTSLAASIFANKRYFVASSQDTELQKADKFNPSGYWEANSLVQCNKETLRAAGFQHDNTWFHEPITESQASNIHDLIQTTEHKTFIEEYNKHSPWVWKDPRLCYTLAYWWPLLDHENTKVLLVTRNHNEIINSFKRVSTSWQTTINLEDSNIEERINDHIASAREILTHYNIPFAEVDYSDYSKNPEKTASKISKLCGIEITKDDFGYKEKANHSSPQGNLIFLIDRTYNKIKKALAHPIKLFTR